MGEIAMSDVRASVGVALLVSLTIIIGLGFFATSSRDLVLVFVGFAFGLIAVLLLEHFRSPHLRQGSTR